MNGSAQKASDAIFTMRKASLEALLARRKVRRRHPEIGGELAEKHFEKRRGNLRLRRANVGRPIAFLRAGEEGELADDENFPGCFLYGAIHDALIVIEQAEPHDLPRKPFDVVGAIGIFHGDECEQAMLNRGFHSSGDGY